ncbi:MAG TPA: hypothetical protein PLY93_12825, partial [Turneriella sp.]|nr:hypothetical protein [Turneriella sp.]
YVAAARRNFTLTADLSITLPWRDEDRLRESKMTVRYAVLPMTAHQRLMGLRATPAVRFSRLDDGAHAAEIMIEQKSTEKTRSYKLQFQATLFNLTHIFNGPVLRQYFKNPTLPEAVRPYVDSLELSPHERTAVEKFRTEWLKRNEGKHPIYAIAAAERDTGLEPSTRCAIYRSLGIPCRRMIFYDLDQKALHTYSQVYIQPTGWVTITPQYSSARPKEFPIANNELELFSPDSVTIHPKPRASTKLSPLPPMSELLKFSNIRIVTSSIE